MIGRQLSHFRILDRIGEGGMGVVYRAEDEKLQRVVALKVLPPEKLADEERRLRFVREARTAAAVTHPNIAVVHEIDEADGVVFIAMELIEGKTLREVIGGKPIPLREALRLGVEIAEGLSAAHEAKVIHRDLKPDNVIVTPGGHVKILDFGLAKLLDERSAIDPEEASKLATVSDEMTQAGRVLGTAAYMSPEQARGLAVDARSDLFSFGIVLYEMVTGKAPFRGTTSMDTLTAILREQPAPAVQLNPEVPAELERIIGKCLEKEPAERYQDARDLVVDLRKVKRDTESQPLRKAEVTARPTTWKRLAWSATAVVVIGLLFAGIWRFLPRQGPKKEPIQRQITANPSDTQVLTFDISPDGRNIAYRDRTGFYVREIDSGETKPLRMPEGFEVFDLVWSSDPTTVFLTATEPQGRSPSLWSFSLMERTPRKVVDSAMGLYGVSPDGRWLLYGASLRETTIALGNAFEELGIADVRGGTLRRIVRSAEGDGVLGGAWSPDSRRLALVRLKQVAGGDPTVSLETRNADGGDVQEILSDRNLMIPLGVAISVVAWLPGGRLLYALREPPPNDSSNLWEATVDPATGRRSGAPRRLSNWPAGHLLWIRASADGRRLAVLRSLPRGDIHLADFDAAGAAVQNLRRFTLDDRGSEDPTWTPDGGSVVFFSARGGKPGLYIQMVDSTVARALVLQSEDPRPFRVSPEGKYILHKSNPVGGGQASLTRVPLAGGASEVVGKMEGWTGFDCPSIPSAPCVSSETREGKVVFSTFDPVTGSGRVIASIDARNPTRRQWDLSPDGSQIAVSDGEEGTVTILRLSDGVRRTLRTEKMDNSGAFWTSSSDAFLVSGTGSKGMLLRMDMEGKSRVVLEWTDTFRMGFTPSPDGRHLAYLVGTLNSNVWLLENF